MPSWWRKIIPTKNERELRRLSAKLPEINALESKLKALPDSQLQAKTAELRERFDRAYTDMGGDPKIRITEGNKEELKKERKRIDAALETIMFDAFATCREAGRRVLNMRHFDVQLIGGMVLHEGKIAEMKTGEGKTLVATLPMYLNALAGRGAHLVTVNEYLAQRDAEWMGRLHNFLGLDVGVVVHGLSDAQRQKMYRAHITYGTNSEFGFDYLRDNMKLFLNDYVQRGQHFAIVDEVDSILIDEARTPLIISGPAEESTDKYLRINAIIPGLRREQDYSIDEKAKTVGLTEAGIKTVEQRLHIDNLYEPDNIEILHHVNQGLRAHTLFRRDVDYMVEDAKVKIVDEFTGRVLEGRRWSDGLHQAVEAKEGVKIENENQTLATITYQNYFRMFLKLAGMTGTAETESTEFSKIYDLDVVVIPTNRVMVREDHHDVIYKTEREKFAAIVEDIQDQHTRGQPVLVGTTSVEKSEVLAKMLKRLRLPHNVLNAKYHRQEAEFVAQAGSKHCVTIATNMAGRGTDIVLGGNPEFLAKAEVDPEENPEGYAAALEKHRVICAANKAEVIKAGGLHIIGTERHEARRIDNQLRGRSGRQGDPGSSRFYLSLEDDLMRIFGGERMMGLMERLGMKEGEVIEHPWVNKSVESAQRRVEGHNFDIRKHLLDYDDVMNDQRIAVYKLRRGVIGADREATREMILDLVEDAIINVVERACPERTHFDEWDMDMLEEMIREQFATQFKLGHIEDLTREELENRVFDAIEKTIKEKEAIYSSDAFFSVSRVIYLQTIDALWKDHLREMDQLREGVSLRGYAQKDPKQEYKKEGFTLFTTMMATIGQDVLQKIFRVVITSQTEDDYEQRLQQQREKQKQLMRMGPAMKGGKGAAKQETVRREGRKVGPNEPCPCGSGKKYKKCCMRVDSAQA
ncbi:MAG: preprotein translocase subunit SecA [Deltaproteobacteria bacterium RIFOXYA12_FULL_58_15]|nr:MAG: preprotein translocase subunit SecA [Deltaproteobacteria bacterium RIFOXYA12_FULL_58_15]